MSDPAIDTLVGRLTPVKPLQAAALWRGAALAVVVAAVYVAILYGMRPELRILTQPMLMHRPMILLKPILFLLLGISALRGVAELARPEGRLRFRVLLPALLLFGAVLGVFIRDVTVYGWAKTFHNAFGAAPLCAMTILCGGTVGVILMWRFWLRRSATSHPVQLGAMSGLSAASLMAGAYAIHCNMDAAVYLLLVYGLAVAVFTGLSALVGRKLYRW
ncbi:MAG TPA: NrsF family protein [Asticcacaulis sp.]|nr:NrsF family protein [Asticcacaulis sp.]